MRRTGILITTYKRPTLQHTLRMLREYGLTERYPTYLLVAEDDPTLSEYRALHGDIVLTYDRKREAEALGLDMMDNLPLGGAGSARAAVWSVGRSIGLTHAIVMDDDYRYFTFFGWRGEASRKLRPRFAPYLVKIFEALLDFVDADPRIYDIALAQTGDMVGGADSSSARRPWKWKAMNVYFWRLDRPFPQNGRLNEDVTCTFDLAQKGLIFGTLTLVGIQQERTQQQPGGLTDLYLQQGTYQKSFYSVMRAPSAVIARYDWSVGRIHHRVDKDFAYPKLLRGDKGVKHRG